MQNAQTKIKAWLGGVRVALAAAGSVFILAGFGAVSITVYGSLTGASLAYAQPEGEVPGQTVGLPEQKTTRDCPQGQNEQECLVDCPKGQCLIDKYVVPIINTISAMVGLVVVISIIVAGIRYSTSADDSQKVSAAKQRIVTSVMVLVGYFALYAFLNWAIPGGLV